MLGVEDACEAKFPNGGLSILELMYIFYYFAGTDIGWGKWLSSEAAEIRYERFMAGIFAVSLWRFFPIYKLDLILN